MKKIITTEAARRHSIELGIEHKPPAVGTQIADLLVKLYSRGLISSLELYEGLEGCRGLLT